MSVAMGATTRGRLDDDATTRARTTAGAIATRAIGLAMTTAREARARWRG